MQGEGVPTGPRGQAESCVYSHSEAAAGHDRGGTGSPGPKATDKRKKLLEVVHRAVARETQNAHRRSSRQTPGGLPRYGGQLPGVPADYGRHHVGERLSLDSHYIRGAKIDAAAVSANEKQLQPLGPRLAKRNLAESAASRHAISLLAFPTFAAFPQKEGGAARRAAWQGSRHGSDRGAEFEEHLAEEELISVTLW